MNLLGAKLYDLHWKPSRRDFLWHNPRILPQTFAIEANFDNYWCGGWDEGFPTCDACDFRGEHYPNLGELRSLRWTVERARGDGEDAVVKLSAFGPISPVRAEKTVTLAGRSPVLRVRYAVTNLGAVAAVESNPIASIVDIVESRSHHVLPSLRRAEISKARAR